jgi:hypothetical protein
MKWWAKGFCPQFRRVSNYRGSCSGLVTNCYALRRRCGDLPALLVHRAHESYWQPRCNHGDGGESKSRIDLISDPTLSAILRGVFSENCGYPPNGPFMARGSYLPRLGLRVELSSSSTWGRADQQTPGTLMRVWGVLFCARKSPRPNARFVRATQMARQSHSRLSRAAIQLFSSSTWGRADQQTSHDSN